MPPSPLTGCIGRETLAKRPACRSAGVGAPSPFADPCGASGVTSRTCYLESRLAYRIQELHFGGLKPETVKRLQELGEQLDGGRIEVRKRRGDDRPIIGTKLIREWQGTDHCVAVLADGYEYCGRPYKSLSAVARAITGTRWNGWTFFGLKNWRGRS